MTGGWYCHKTVLDLKKKCILRLLAGQQNSWKRAPEPALELQECPPEVTLKCSPFIGCIIVV